MAFFCCRTASRGCASSSKATAMMPSGLAYERDPRLRQRTVRAFYPISERSRMSQRRPQLIQSWCGRIREPAELGASQEQHKDGIDEFGCTTGVNPADHEGVLVTVGPSPNLSLYQTSIAILVAPCRPRVSVFKMVRIQNG